MMIVAAIALVMGLGIRAARLLGLAHDHHRHASAYRDAAMFGSFRTRDHPGPIYIIDELKPGEVVIRLYPPSTARIIKSRAVHRVTPRERASRVAAYHDRRAEELGRSAFCFFLPVSNEAPPPEP